MVLITFAILIKVINLLLFKNEKQSLYKLILENDKYISLMKHIIDYIAEYSKKYVN